MGRGDDFTVRYDLMAWARREQGITMRCVVEQGGPSVGLQSAVENGQRTCVTKRTLHKWVQALGITVPFALGQVPRYRENPEAICHLASEFGRKIRSQQSQLGREQLWSRNGAQSVLRMIESSVSGLPSVVLAYVGGVSLADLNQQLSGESPLSHDLVQLAASMVGVPFSQMTEESTGQSYREVLELAEKMGAGADELESLLLVFLPILRMTQAERWTPKQIQNQFFNRDRAGLLTTAD